MNDNTVTFVYGRYTYTVPVDDIQSVLVDIANATMIVTMWNESVYRCFYSNKNDLYLTAVVLIEALKP